MAILQEDEYGSLMGGAQSNPGVEMTDERQLLLPILQVALVQFVFSVFLLVCTLGGDARAASNDLVQFGKYVQFELGPTGRKTKFKVKRAYLRGASRKRVELSRVDLWALLPDFEAYHKDKNRFEFMGRRGWGRKLFIVLKSRAEGVASVAEIIRTSVENLKNTPLSGRLGRYDELLYGLEVYRSSSFLADEYLYRPKGGRQVIISCASEKQSVPYPSCRMRWDVGKGVAGVADFGMGYLSDWKAILRRSNELVDADK